MSKGRTIELLEDIIRLAGEREKSHLELLGKQSEQIKNLQRQTLSLQTTIKGLNQTVDTLNQSLKSLKEALIEKDGTLEGLENQNRGLSKMLFRESEKMARQKTAEGGSAPLATIPENPVSPTTAPPEESAARKRGNNNAKRKKHFDLEVIEEDVYPDDPNFNKEWARLIGKTTVTRYEYIPPRFIEHIYNIYRYSQDETVYSGKAPIAPLLNSAYDASFIAGMFQLRYIYSLPVERIIKLFGENGFSLEKSTAHGLLSKSAALLERLDEVLHHAILEDPYLSMDESYYTILTGEKNEQGKGVRKGYFWAALAYKSNLMHFFYKDGARTEKVLLDYIQGYEGAIQSDALCHYKLLETDSYPHILRLSCFQHNKRQFLDIKEDPQALEIINLINTLYQREHEIPDDAEPAERLRFRQEYAPPILAELQIKLLTIQADPDLLPRSQLAKATNYMLNEFKALTNCFLSAEYKLDNNAIERQMRYISLSRKNSLFCGSHEGARRAALFYSLACSCRLHGINTFDYFKDILNKMAIMSPTAPEQQLRDLLPDKWLTNKI